MTRILADENIPAVVIVELRRRGYDVAWILEDMPGATDAEVVGIARGKNRILLTADKGFGELVFSSRARVPGVILLRALAAQPVTVARLVGDVLDQRIDWAGHFAVIEHGRLRLLPLPRRAGESERPSRS